MTEKFSDAYRVVTDIRQVTDNGGLCPWGIVSGCILSDAVIFADFLRGSGRPIGGLIKISDPKDWLDGKQPQMVAVETDKEGLLVLDYKGRKITRRFVRDSLLSKLAEILRAYESRDLLPGTVLPIEMIRETPEWLRGDLIRGVAALRKGGAKVLKN